MFRTCKNSKTPHSNTYHNAALIFVNAFFTLSQIFCSNNGASICLTPFRHSLTRYFNCTCNTSISNFSPYLGKVNFLIIGTAFCVKTYSWGTKSSISAQVCVPCRGRQMLNYGQIRQLLLQTFGVPVRASTHVQYSRPDSSGQKLESDAVQSKNETASKVEST